MTNQRAKEIAELMWDNFVMAVRKDAGIPRIVNFLGSVEKHKVLFMKANSDLLKEMERKVLVPVDFIKNVSQLINYIDEEGPTAKAWEPITEICESIKAMIAERGSDGG